MTGPGLHAECGIGASFLRLAVMMACLLAPLSAGADPWYRPQPAPADPFHLFVESLWLEAQRRHVARTTFDAAFTGLTIDPAIIKLTHAGQAEFVRPIWDYIAANVSAGRIAAGRSNAVKWGAVLDRAASRFGVDREVLMAVWGMESGYGTFTGRQNVIRSLATLAFIGYRKGLFRAELLDALDIVQAGDIAPARMRGSWAGAMGQTQFLPSSFKAFAIDFDGDGRRDIWTSVPDALGSTANFLKRKGWIAGQPWGFEVVLPENFDLTHRETLTPAPFAQWTARGIRRTFEAAMPASGAAALLIPAGLRGPAFLVTPNFSVIKAYNLSTAYALSVCLLADRIAGRPPLVAAWPTKERVLDSAQAKDLQTRLKNLGYDVGSIDGMLGEQARDAIVHYQAKVHLVPDGFPTLALLQQIRGAP